MSYGNRTYEHGKCKLAETTISGEPLNDNQNLLRFICEDEKSAKDLLHKIESLPNHNDWAWNIMPHKPTGKFEIWGSMKDNAGFIIQELYSRGWQE